jgi:hypothetical protein
MSSNLYKYCSKDPELFPGPDPYFRICESGSRRQINYGSTGSGSGYTTLVFTKVPYRFAVHRSVFAVFSGMSTGATNKQEGEKSMKLCVPVLVHFLTTYVSIKNKFNLILKECFCELRKATD